MASFPIAAHAGWAEGPWSNFVVNGITYSTEPAILTTPSTGFSTAYTYVTPTFICVTAGSLAAQGRVVQMYETTGAVLVSESPTSYSTSTVCGGSPWAASASYAGHGNFYSYGRSYAYDASNGIYYGFMTIPGYVQPA